MILWTSTMLQFPICSRSNEPQAFAMTRFRASVTSLLSTTPSAFMSQGFVGPVGPELKEIYAPLLGAFTGNTWPTKSYSAVPAVPVPIAGDADCTRKLYDAA